MPSTLAMFGINHRFQPYYRPAKHCLTLMYKLKRLFVFAARIGKDNKWGVISKQPKIIHNQMCHVRAGATTGKTNQQRFFIQTSSPLPPQTAPIPPQRQPNVWGVFLVQMPSRTQSIPKPSPVLTFPASRAHWRIRFW